MHSVAGLAGECFGRTACQFGGLWRRGHVPSDFNPGIARGSCRRGSIRCRVQPLLFYRLRFDSILDRDHRRRHDPLRFWTCFHIDLDFLSACNVSPSVLTRPFKGGQADMRIALELKPTPSETAALVGANSMICEDKKVVVVSRVRLARMPMALKPRERQL